MTKNKQRKNVGVLFDVNHPAHAHFFKYAILELKKRNNYSVYVTSTTKEVNEEILNAYNIAYLNIGHYRVGLIKKFIDFLKVALKYLHVVRKIKPDLVLSMSSARPFARLVSKSKLLVFDDTEHAWEQIALYKPFAYKIFTPDCFTKDLGPKQVKYPGYHQLAYLHPNRYTPDLSVLNHLGLNKDSGYFVLRFVAWHATHDVGQTGISHQNKIKLVQTLKTFGRVVVLSEEKLPDEFDEYRISICPSKTHDLLYFATLYIGEGATMASECATLGTPCIYVNSLNLGYIQEQERLGLVYSLRNDKQLINLVKHLLDGNLPDQDENRKRAKNAISKKIDLTGYILEIVDNFSKN